MLRHRAAEFIRFLRLIDRQTPPELDLHLILDNYAAHKTEAVKRWFARHPRFHVHFTPTSASWINAVEGLFATLTKRRLRRGVFRSVIELSQAISDYLDAHNADPKPFHWTAPADTIIAKHQRGKRLLESLHSHVRQFKLQAREFLASSSSCSACPLLDRAGGTIMKRRLIML
jgi:hypothetical protein